MLTRNTERELQPIKGESFESFLDRLYAPIQPSYTAMDWIRANVTPSLTGVESSVVRFHNTPETVEEMYAGEFTVPYYAAIIPFCEARPRSENV